MSATSTPTSTSTPVRYLRLLGVQLRASTLLAFQYRAEVILHALTALFWSVTTFVPLYVAFDQRDVIAGWSLPEALVVLGFFLLLKSVLEGVVNPSLLQVVEHIRKGTLDFVLLKPVDAQFLVSTARLDPAALLGGVVAAAAFVAGFAELGAWPGPVEIATALLILTAAVAVLYSLSILVVSAAFVVVRVDNLTYLFASIFDAARWPSSVFRGVFHVLFTFVIPLALMTTYPAEALLQRMSVERAAGALLGALVFAAVSRRMWRGSLGRYTSASS